MEINRLERMAALLEDYVKAPAPNITINLRDWTEPLTRRTIFGREFSCGTAACAVGLALLKGTFAKDGLYFSRRRDIFLPHYRHDGCLWANWDAVEAFFDLKSELAHRLFDSSAYKKKTGVGAAAAVARRIRALVRLERYWQRKATIAKLQEDANLRNEYQAVRINGRLYEIAAGIKSGDFA